MESAVTFPTSLTRYAWLSIAAAIATILLKGVAWWLTGSVGLLSDAIESFVNLAGALMALWMLTLAARPADDNHTYGYSKAEYFSSSLSDYPSAKSARFTMWDKKPDFPGFLAFPRDFPSFSLLWTQYGQALQIPGEANQRPLAGDLLQAAQGEAAKAHHRLDDPEDRLDRLLA
jgi:hypothetical protein